MKNLNSGNQLVDVHSVLAFMIAEQNADQLYAIDTECVDSDICEDIAKDNVTVKEFIEELVVDGPQDVMDMIEPQAGESQPASQGGDAILGGHSFDSEVDAVDFADLNNADAIFARFNLLLNDANENDGLGPLSSSEALGFNAGSDSGFIDIRDVLDFGSGPGNINPGGDDDGGGVDPDNGGSRGGIIIVKASDGVSKEAGFTKVDQGEMAGFSNDVNVNADPNPNFGFDMNVEHNNMGLMGI